VAALGRYTLQIVRAPGGISGWLRGWRSVPRFGYTPGKEEGDQENQGYEPEVSSHG